MPKIFCPICKKTLDKVYMITEMESEWDPTEEFYVPISSKDFHDYYKCIKCGSILQEKGKTLPKNQGDIVVYGHQMRRESALFHIGSGSERRARTLINRSALWQNFVDTHGGVKRVEVLILERHHCPARARLREMELVKIHQPPTNRFGRSFIPSAILDGRPKGSKKRCNCGAPDCYGAEVAARNG